MVNMNLKVMDNSVLEAYIVNLERGRYRMKKGTKWLGDWS